jgi:hypothetical protein
VFDWARFSADVEETGPRILDSGVVEGPPAGPFASPFAGSRAYPLAVDRDGDIGAVAYAALNGFTNTAPGWWCVAMRFTRLDGVWRAGDHSDAHWSQRPFERPSAPENSVVEWLDWGINGSLGGYGPADEPRYRHLLHGIAPAGTARLTVTDGEDRTRELTITPWCGAYVATVDGPFSRLTGFAADGRELGSFVCLDGSTD